MKQHRIVCLLILLVFATKGFADEIRVAAASDLQFAMEVLGRKFEQQTGHKLLVSYGSSGNLYAQIQNHAPYDLFFSADSELPKKLADSGVAELQSLYRYGRGSLVLWAPKDSGIDPATAHFDVLLGAAVKKIAIANPQHAPYGRAAEGALRTAKLYGRIRAKLVYGENISQAAQFVQSGNAQVGLIAKSLVLAPAMQNKGLWWELPVDSYPPIEQAVVLLRGAQHADAARAFLSFLKSPAAREVLEAYGFRKSE